MRSTLIIFLSVLTFSSPNPESVTLQTSNAQINQAKNF
jgi:hypothetical protein